MNKITCLKKVDVKKSIHVVLTTANLDMLFVCSKHVQTLNPKLPIENPQQKRLVQAIRLLLALAKPKTQPTGEVPCRFRCVSVQFF